MSDELTEQEREAEMAAMRTAPTGAGGSADAAHGFRVAREFYRAALVSSERANSEIRARAAARAAFDYASESDEHTDRFEAWWAAYSQECGVSEAQPQGDGERVERLREAVVELWRKTPPGSTPELHECLGMTWPEYQAWNEQRLPASPFARKPIKRGERPSVPSPAEVEAAAKDRAVARDFQHVVESAEGRGYPRGLAPALAHLIERDEKLAAARAATQEES